MHHHCLAERPPTPSSILARIPTESYLTWKTIRFLVTPIPWHLSQCHKNLNKRMKVLHNKNVFCLSHYRILNVTVQCSFLFSLSLSGFSSLIPGSNIDISALFVDSSGVLEISCSCSTGQLRSWRLLRWNGCMENLLCVCFLPPLRLEMWGLSFLIILVLYTCNWV